MVKNPIESFKSKEEFLETCKYWKEVLYLNDWAIKFELVEDAIEDDSGQYVVGQLLGECSFNFINKQAHIQVDNKHCIAELTLVHELLHLITPFISESALVTENIEEDYNVYKEAVIHQSMEQMAKTLILVRYPKIDKKFFLKELNY